MYHVIEMYGDFEPWWFLEDWKDDIVETYEFENYYDALKCYKSHWLDLRATHDHFDSRSDLMSAFWKEDDQRWCEECDEYLQQFHSVALLHDWTAIPKSMERPGYSKKHGQSQPMSSCSFTID